MNKSVERGLIESHSLFVKGCLERLLELGLLTCSVESAMSNFDLENVCLTSKRSVAAKKKRAKELLKTDVKKVKKLKLKKLKIKTSEKDETMEAKLLKKAKEANEANEAQREKEANGLPVQSNKVLQRAKRNLKESEAKPKREKEER